MSTESQSVPGSGCAHCLHFLERVRLSDGGVVRAVLDLCEVLASRGHMVNFATRDPADVPASWSDSAGPSVVIVGNRGSDPTLRRAIEKADVVHLHGMWDLSNYAVARVARRTKTPWLVSPHGMLDIWPMSQKRFKKRVFWRLAGKGYLEQAAAVHFTAEAERQQSQRWLGRGRGVVAPLAVNLSQFEDLPGPELAERSLELPNLARILFLSRVHPKKGVEVLLESAAELAATGTAFSLFIAGPGEAAYVSALQSQAKKLGISEQTRFVGTVKGSMKLSLYQAADVFVLPTQQENFGLVQIEAMACGTPVVTTRGVDIWQELASAGAMVVDREASAIAAAIRKVLEAQQDLGSAGRRWVFETLSPDYVAVQYEQIYADAMADSVAR